MSSALEGIKALMRRCEGLPDNMSETEVRHYAAEVLKRLRRGENIQTLELFLRRINTSNSGRFNVLPATQKLAESVFMLFSGLH